MRDTIQFDKIFQGIKAVANDYEGATMKLCDVFDNEHYSRIKAMTDEEFQADLVRRQAKELEGFDPKNTGGA
jgi:hypothetical protein